MYYDCSWLKARRYYHCSRVKARRYYHCSRVKTRRYYDCSRVKASYPGPQENQLRTVRLASFLELDNLQTLTLSNNPLASFLNDPASILLQSRLTVLHLSFITMTQLDPQMLSVFPQLQKLNLTSTSIHSVVSSFQALSQLVELHMDDSPVVTFLVDIFTDLSRLKIIRTENYKRCCSAILPEAFESSSCHAPRDESCSCEDLLESLLSGENQKVARDFCSRLGATFTFPTCDHGDAQVYSLVGTPNREYLVGLSSYEGPLRSLYRHAIITDDNTVIYHSFRRLAKYTGNKKCFLWRMSLASASVFTPVAWDCKDKLETGVVCKFNNSEQCVHNFPSEEISLARTSLVLPSRQRSLVTCPDGHMTFAFLLCHSDVLKERCQSHSMCVFYDKTEKNQAQVSDTAIPVPLFECRSQTVTLSYTLVCNFLSDCPDSSDETFCIHPPCAKEFMCSNGQCLSYDKMCDQLFHCWDQSDETNCGAFTQVLVLYEYVLSPALVRFGENFLFKSVSMKSNESCPDTHYRCPGEFNDCLPVYTRCNGMFDCFDHQDEQGCENLTCAGFLRCRTNGGCVHTDHLCDGWSHCPLHDDELTCDMTCPVHCQCQGHTFRCSQPFSAAHFPQLRSLDATGSGMTLSDVRSHSYLIHLVLAQCSLTNTPNISLSNLHILDLRGNQLRTVRLASFLKLDNLKTLTLSSNPLASFLSDPASVLLQSRLTVLDLSFITMTQLDPQMMSVFPQLQKLNLTSTSIHSVVSSFQALSQLVELHMDDSPVVTFPVDIFSDLSRLKIIRTENYKLCCSAILPEDFESSSCHAPWDEISSCEDLLESWTYRVFLWIIACMSLTGNIFCFCARLVSKQLTAASGFSMFVINLTLADFLMGVYITIIGVADERFRGKYLHHDDTWKHSVTCKVAGFLSMLSSEVSALIICLITLDRFIVLRFPFSSVRFGKTSTRVACLLTWLAGWFLSVLPLLPMTSHWEFYSQTGICIPLPVTRRDFPGKHYSLGVLIFLNFFLFLTISLGQLFIYRSVQHNALKTNSTRKAQDITLARRLISVAVTDFLCWFPIGLCGILALVGISISREVVVALAIYILPLNSAANPFLYTLNTVDEKMRKSYEAEFLQWLQSSGDQIN